MIPGWSLLVELVNEGSLHNLGLLSSGRCRSCSIWTCQTANILRISHSRMIMCTVCVVFARSHRGPHGGRHRRGDVHCVRGRWSRCLQDRRLEYWNSTSRLAWIWIAHEGAPLRSLDRGIHHRVIWMRCQSAAAQRGLPSCREMQRVDRCSKGGNIPHCIETDSC